MGLKYFQNKLIPYRDRKNVTHHVTTVSEESMIEKSKRKTDNAIPKFPDEQSGSQLAISVSPKIINFVTITDIGFNICKILALFLIHAASLCHRNA